MPDLPHELTRLYERIPIGMRLGLDPMRAACRSLGSPEGSFPTLHVAGSNGKGSVCAMTSAIAKEHGLRTGLYTSPHLCRFAERIRIDGEPIEDTALARFLAIALDVQPELSFFEAATLAAFLAFREARVDVAVIEVGIGGRLDATNVVPKPLAGAITRIALDHTDRLGSTLVAIAREKAGIAKPGVPIVVGPMPPDVRAAIDEVARDHSATTVGVDDVEAPTVIGLAGEHQRDNARVAAALGARLGASKAAVERGIAAVRWPGRLERVGTFLLDAAHNPDGAEALARHLRGLGRPAREVALVFGTLGDKDWGPMLDVLAPLAGTRVYVAPHGASRPPSDPRDMAARQPGAVVEDTAQALRLASEDRERLVVVAGSLVLIGEARALLLGLPRDPPVSL
ncbi:MAG TPA: folylpolyglutamate synthase/dihydrofolate synthase family protein [Polyangiaceae bacterium]|nr:folylpolyglutamate synthase/dihydrofolate synthase family protein [Polyangiaceae bacterium]